MPPIDYDNNNNEKIGYIIIAFIITLIAALILARIISARLKLKRYNDFFKKENTEITATNHPQKTHSIIILLITEIIAISIFALGVHLFGKRNVEYNDLEINYKSDFTTLSIKCNIIPKENIEDLALEFNIYNYNKEKIACLNKTIGDVKKNKQYSVTININEINLLEKPYTSDIKISNGKIRLLF